jgi:hypothetical protein
MNTSVDYFSQNDWLSISIIAVNKVDIVGSPEGILRRQLGYIL